VHTKSAIEIYMYKYIYIYIYIYTHTHTYIYETIYNKVLDKNLIFIIAYDNAYNKQKQMKIAPSLFLPKPPKI